MKGPIGDWLKALVGLVIVLGCAKGKLVFRTPLHEPRVYSGAPAGVPVAAVAAHDPSSSGGRRPGAAVIYNLLDVRDHIYFSVDSASGNISTAKTIDRKVGESYEIIAVAISQGETKLRQLKVSVTEFNAEPPVFEHPVYRGELHVRAKVGATVLRVRATDADPVPYNAEVFYRLEPPLDERFVLDPRSGLLTLARPLDSGPPATPLLQMALVAQDGGSPPRSDVAKIEVLIKTISEPRDVRSANATGSTVQVCWSRPEYGQVLGYIVKYRETAQPHGPPSFLNVTSDAASKCSALVELKPWTDYEFRVYGWNRFETGQGSAVGRFGTRPDYCQMNICQHGECHVLNEEPGYHCDCARGHYGDVCDKFDACSLSPCDNYGACRNVSSHQYRCDCLSGFSGRNCSDFNPCALRPSPCLHGGRCESTASHTYTCYCARGYFGKTCQSFDPCSLDPCRNGAACHNASQTEYVCKCPPGFTGKQCEVDVDECASSPCKHGATCRDGVNSFHCRCSPGYRGKRCHLIEHCPSQTVASGGKGVFRWNATSHGRAQLLECPFGSSFAEAAAGFAKRRCYLLSNGSVAWGKMDLDNCREEGFKQAEDLTVELRDLTRDARHLNVDRLQEATDRIEAVLQYALTDKKIAENMLSIVSNMLSINETLLRMGDVNGTTARRVTDLVDRFASEVRLERGEVMELSTENVAVRAVSWDPPDVLEDGLHFAVHYTPPRADSSLPQHTSYWDEDTTSLLNDAELTIPLEAVLLAQNQTGEEELRIKFVAYKNDKFFRERHSVRWRQCTASQRRNCLQAQATGFSGRRVLQASISNATISNLSDPLLYVLPSPLNVRVFCAYWKEHERVWSTEGIITNQSGNSTACLSTHMTSFSLLLDPTPGEGISADHLFTLSLISYIGCGLSMLGLVLTIITYSMFRCLNRDPPGQILLQLCLSLLLLNAAFVAGGQWSSPGSDGCAAVAAALHFALLAALAWMAVEALNMYALLVHVFASPESHFMLKRAILAWGIPFVIVGVTVLMDWEVYYNQNEYCMLSGSASPLVYYAGLVGPACLLLLVNLSVFLMVTRVLFSPRHPSAAKTTPSKSLVTAAQVRGAFTVMVLLGVSWVLGVFAVGEARLVFQYIFCVANSLQGFLIFVVRCLHYPEARSAWYQLLKTGTFKKYRGKAPPGGSWSGGTLPPSKQNGHSTSTRLGSADLGAPFWAPEKAALPKGDLDDPLPPADPLVLDYATRGQQFLTFSSTGTLKSNASTEKARRGSKIKSISRSNSESSQVAGGDEVTSYPFGGVLPPCAVVVVGEPSSAPAPLSEEPKSRSSYASSIGYIDESLDRKIFASKTSSLFNNHQHQQNSWPRTLSSFMGGKEPPERLPLHVRPSTPSSSPCPHHQDPRLHQGALHPEESTLLTPQQQRTLEEEEEEEEPPQPAPPDSSTFKVWERQVSPAAADPLFVDSAASRL